MSAMIARIGTPFPGKQAQAYKFAVERAATLKKMFGIKQKVYIRFGGPVGQIVGVSKHENVGKIAELKSKVIAATNDGKIPSAPKGIFRDVREAIYLQP